MKTILYKGSMTARISSTTIFVFVTEHFSIFVIYHYEVCGQLIFMIIILEVYLIQGKSNKKKNQSAILKGFES